MKTITACAAINEGTVDPNKVMSTDRNDSRYYNLPGDSHQMDDLMAAAYSNKKDIRDRVADIVTTYHPSNPEVTVVKDAKYVALV